VSAAKGKEIGTVLLKSFRVHIMISPAPDADMKQQDLVFALLAYSWFGPILP
jgi:hypothetical protein